MAVSRPHHVEHRSVVAGVAGAYDRTGATWAGGPAQVYGPLAEALVALSPVGLTGRTVVDIGAGTGAASQAITRAGGRPVAVDLAPAMLRACDVPRVAVADAVALPIPTGALGGSIAAFSLNHLTDPAAGLREAARVCRPGSPVLASAYATDDTHPVKAAVDQAATEAGWRPEPWYATMREHIVGRLGTVAGMDAAATAARVTGRVRHIMVDIDGLSPDDLVTWRLGMAQIAPFLSSMPAAGPGAVAARARELLGDRPPPLRRSIIVFAGVAPSVAGTRRRR